MNETLVNGKVSRGGFLLSLAGMVFLRFCVNKRHHQLPGEYKFSGRGVLLPRINNCPASAPDWTIALRNNDLVVRKDGDWIGIMDLPQN